MIGCDLCGESRVQPLFTPRGRRRPWSYHVVRCPACGFLYRNPGIRPERLGDLYSGRYGRFLTGKYARERRRRYRGPRRLRPGVRRRRGPPAARLRLRRRAVPRARARARLRRLRRRPLGRLGRARPHAPRRRQRPLRLPARGARDRRGRLRRRDAVVGDGAPRRAARGPQDAARPARPGRRPAGPDRERQFAPAEGAGRGVGRLHAEPPEVLRARDADAGAARGGLRGGRRAADVLRRARGRHARLAPRGAPAAAGDRSRQPRQHAARARVRRGRRPAAVGSRTGPG